jgi:hypothetical protein
LETKVDIHENSMPLRFTPDGLDESTIDALIEEANAQFSDVDSAVLKDAPAHRPARRRAGKATRNTKAAA